MVLRQVIRDLASVTAPRNAARYATGNVGDSGSLRNLLRPVDRMPNCCGRAGHWSAWLTEHFRGSKRTSQADMRLAISITLMGGYAQISAHLRHDQLRCLLTGFMAGNWPRTGAPLRHDVVAFNQRLAAAALPKPPLCLLPTAYCLLPTAYCLLPLKHRLGARLLHRVQNVHQVVGRQLAEELRHLVMQLRRQGRLDLFHEFD
jgi:hypothetical protein